MPRPTARRRPRLRGLASVSLAVSIASLAPRAGGAEERQAGPDAVTRFVLVDAATDADIGELTPGTVVNLATVGTQSLNVRAETSPTVVGSVVFDLDGTQGYRTESTPPYALAGDDGGDYAHWLPSVGSHSITATPFSESGGAGSAGAPLKADFSVIDDPNVVPPIVDAGPTAYVLLPESSVVLEGTAFDPDDGGFLEYEWAQTAGAPAELSGVQIPTLTVEGLAEGNYVFQLTATDDQSLSTSDDVAVLVRPADVLGGNVSGVLETWHRITIEFAGDPTSEDAEPNPFRDTRLNVLFQHESGRSVVVPGHFAADGDAGETSATAGPIWRVHFLADAPGVWTYIAFFHAGADVAASLDPVEGVPSAFDGVAGVLTVAPTTASAPDLRAQGLLRYVGEHHLRFAQSGEWFLKGGANSPENFLAYYEFDGTYDLGGNANDLVDGLHRYAPHAGDWAEGDPTWQAGAGKGIIGAINYLAGAGMNSVYFLTMNVEGDGQEVWPWSAPDERDRFDLSKLDQWEIVFSHMDSRGVMMHVVTQEHENDQLLGSLSVERKLYYRELISRFGHHPALTWNLGEENTNTPEERDAFSEYIRALDPYGHPIVVHTRPDEQDLVLAPLLGGETVDGASVQTDPAAAAADVERWRDQSESAGRKWVVTLDELTPSGIGVLPDSVDATHDMIRRDALWGSLMAGGAGCEWYFGYDHPDDDLDCENWRSREAMWTQTAHALSFFRANVPYWEMAPRNELAGPGAACLVKTWDTYLVHLPSGGTTTLDLDGAVGPFRVRWFDPLTGGPLQDGSVGLIEGPGDHPIGDPPYGQGSDWVVLVTRDFSVGVDDVAESVPTPAIGVLSPNPASVTLSVPLALPAAGPTRVSVHDISGRLVREIVAAHLSSGRHVLEWDGADETARRVAPGIYWIRLESREGTDAEKVLWLD